MITSLRSSLLYSCAWLTLVSIPACAGGDDELPPAEQQGEEVRSLETAAEPVRPITEADRTLAEQGDVDAQARLARAYYLGLGAAQDFQEALRWARLAADQDSGVGQGVLAAAYNSGNGVAQDFEEAAHWALLAADQGNADGRGVLAFLYRNGQGGLEENPEEAVRQALLAAEQGHHSSQAFLGMMYMGGEGGLERDFVTAYMWMTLAASGQGIDVPLDTVSIFMSSEQIEEAQDRAREWRRSTQSEVP